jgi:hypothetical protein
MQTAEIEVTPAGTTQLSPLEKAVVKTASPRAISKPPAPDALFDSIMRFLQLRHKP